MSNVWQQPPQRGPYSVGEQYRRFRTVFLTLAQHPLAREVPPEMERRIMAEFARLQRITLEYHE